MPCLEAKVVTVSWSALNVTGALILLTGVSAFLPEVTRWTLTSTVE
jgi:hypothetical protein